LQKNISGETTIRQAAAADARAIAEVHVASWKVNYRGIVPDAWLDKLSVDSCHASWVLHFEEMKPRERCFVSLNSANNFTGFANAGPAKTFELGTDGELYAIYVAPDAQRSGTGRALMHRAVVHLRDAGFRSMCLWLLKDNPARGFYERFGGRILSEKPFSREGFTLPSIGCKWDDIDALAESLRV
jgi:ribosomal protein S18 acetylase RimI-like enzyme